MGGAAGVRQGLAIKTIEVQFTPAKHKTTGKPLASGRLVRTTEVAVVGDPGVQAAGAEAIRTFGLGLKIGMRFRNAHKIVSVRWASGNALPAPTAFKSANKNQAIINACEDVFGAAGQWYAFRINAADITPPWPLTYPVDQDRLYFRVTVDKFLPHLPMDFHEVPVVAVLGSFADFTQHYALGMGLFTLGTGNNAIQFDSEVVGVK
jgi:hypothetical protein